MEDKYTGTAKLKTYIHITRITIALCWIALFAFWAIKLFGGNWFEIVVENKNFIKFSNIVQNTWVKYLVSFITIAVAKYLTFGAICQKFYFKGKQLLIVILSTIYIWYCANFVNNQFMIMFGGYIPFVLLGIIYQKGWKKSFGVIAIVLETIFSVISALTRNIPILVMSNYLIASIFIFDLYLMTALYYLYSNLNKLKKEIK